MGATQSRPADDESLGIAEMFARTPSIRQLPFLARLAILFPWTRGLVVRRLPARTRHAGLDSIDSIGEMRAVLSAMGGWDEHHERDPLRPTGRERQLRRQVQRQQQREEHDRRRRGGREGWRRSASRPTSGDEADDGYYTAIEASITPTARMLDVPPRIPLPSPSMAPLPLLLEADDGVPPIFTEPEQVAVPSTPAVDPGNTTKATNTAAPRTPHVKIASPRRKLAELRERRELRHVKDIKERRRRRRLDSHDSYAAYAADLSSMDDSGEGRELCERWTADGGKGTARAIVGGEMRRRRV